MIKKIIVFLIFFLVHLHGVEDDVVYIDAATGETPLSFQSPVADTSLVQENIFLSYVDKPSKVYIGEVFKVTLKALIVDSYDEIELSYMQGHDVMVINEDVQWEKIAENTYKADIYMSLNSISSIVPHIKVSIFKDALRLGVKSIDGIRPEVIKIDGDERYCGVVAQHLEVENYKATSYSESSNMIVLGIKATHASLIQFKLPNIKKQGIDSSFEKFPEESIYYFAVIPKTVNHFVFSYFNIQKNKFEKISIPVTVEKEPLSTQIEINPKDSKYHYYVKMLLGAMGVLFMIIFMFRRKIIYLIFVLILVGVIFYDKVIVEEVSLRENAPIRILPTKNSTVVFKVSSQIKVERVKTYRGFSKVIFDGGKIGWVKDAYVLTP